MADKNPSENLELNVDKGNNNFQKENVKKKPNIKMDVRKISTLSDSIINYFSIGVCFFLNSAYNLGWFKIKDGNNSVSIFTYFLIAAGVLYIIGIMNWYEGKEILFLFDFVLCFYFHKKKKKNGLYGNILDNLNQNIIDISSDNYEIQEIFYILLFCLFFVMGFSAFKKGLIYIINYFILFIGFLFLFLDCYFDREKDWIKKTHSYIFIVSGALMWIIGILKIINQGFLLNDIPLLGQTD